MKTKYKISILFSFVFILFALLITNPVKTYAKEARGDSKMESLITSEVESKVRNGTLPPWHLNYVNNTGYQCFYYKMTHLNSDDDSYYRSLPESKIITYSNWYKNKTDETWDYILKNLDIDTKYLEPNEYLGLYFDSYAYDKKDCANLYLIWTSEYLPSEFVNITQVKESNKIYNLYDSKSDMDNLHSNWFDSTYYHFKENNLSLWITPIGGIENGKNYGLPLKESYNFQGFTYGLDDAQFGKEADPNHYFDGEVKAEMTFDFGQKPENNGKNMMKLCTHAYEYITDIEAQSFYDLGFGGYKHMVHFNLSINPDKIYRVDTLYTISNSNKSWIEFWRPSDSHTIMKSLTPDKTKGGFLGLFNYQGFKQGSFSSVNNPSKQYKYELLLDYDDNGWGWKIFTGQEYKESDYKKIDEFKILRINYLLDEKVYDVAIKMDTIEGDTYNILSPNLIEDEASNLHQFKTWTNEVVNNIKDKLSKYKTWLFAVAGAIGVVIIIVVVIRVRMLFRYLLTPPDYFNNNQNDKKERKK